MNTQTATPVFSHFADAGKKVDHRSKQSMIDYLSHHDTHRDGYEAPKFANCVKFNWGALRNWIREPYLSQAGALLEQIYAGERPEVFWEIGERFDLFAEHFGYPIVQEGRSGGWFALDMTESPLEYVGSPGNIDTYRFVATFSELRRVCRLVEAFDRACDDAVAIFMSHALETEPEPEPETSE